MKLALTGSNGKLGTVVELELREAGHDVVALDAVGPRRDGFTRIDLTDSGSVFDALSGIDERHRGLDGVVHIGAVPAPGLETDVATFRNNMLATFNVIHGARKAGIRRVVFAPSETVLGLPFEIDPPYAPRSTSSTTPGPRASTRSPSTLRRSWRAKSRAGMPTSRSPRCGSPT
jgi:UDP-glucose 4-epimerase